VACLVSWVLTRLAFTFILLQFHHLRRSGPALIEGVHAICQRGHPPDS
jgi:hypothetical protein